MSSSVDNVPTAGKSLTSSASQMLSHVQTTVVVAARIRCCRMFWQSLLANGFVATAAPERKYRSRMMEHFQLENVHRGAYVAGTVSPKQRTATVAAIVDKA